MQLIEQSGVLEAFLERTPADFYVWVTRHHQEMEQRYGKRVGVLTSTYAFKQEHPRTLVGKLLYTVRTVLSNLWTRLRS